jgi:hypothetical protein
VTGHHGHGPPGKRNEPGAQHPARSSVVQPGKEGFGGFRIALDPGDPRFIQAADLALATGGFVVAEHDDLGVTIVLMSDTFVLQGIANGLEPLPTTFRLIRADGRCLYGFQLPEGSWAA